MICILIDEVESLTAARKAAVQGAEPSDALRAVNAMLTHLDQLKAFKVRCRSQGPGSRFPSTLPLSALHPALIPWTPDFTPLHSV